MTIFEILYAGTILYTSATAAIRGSAKFSAFAIAKHGKRCYHNISQIGYTKDTHEHHLYLGLKALSQSVAREHAKDGVHACHIRIDAIIDTPSAQNYPWFDADKASQPDEIAETYWSLHTQGLVVHL